MSGKKVIALCFSVVEKVAALGGAYAAFEQFYPTILAWVEPLRGLIMPKYFWQYGFEAKDRERMLAELAAAHTNAQALESKYSYYPTKDKLAVESAYRQILRELESI